MSAAANPPMRPEPSRAAANPLSKINVQYLHIFAILAEPIASTLNKTF